MVAKPLATLLTLLSFLGGLRITALDGTVMDVPDTPENARVFGYPGSRPGTYPAFPKARERVFGRSRYSFNYRCNQ